MSSETLMQQLAEYDNAVRITRETYRGMSQDERAARQMAAGPLAKHAPSDRTDPKCAACDGAEWPCSTVLNAINHANPRYN